MVSIPPIATVISLSSDGITPYGNSYNAVLSYSMQGNNGTYYADADYVKINPINVDSQGWQLLELEARIGESGVLTAQIFNFEQGKSILFDDWTIEVIAPSTLEIVQEMHYDPWGLPMQEECYQAPPSGAGGLTDFTFNGKELQTFADLYLYDYHWRQYDPQLGRWHSTDPADQVFGLSGYAYCGNNPIMNIDPDGRLFIVDDILIGMAVGALIGAVTSSLVYGVTAGISGNFSWQGMGQAFAIGAVGGAISGGVGTLGSTLFGSAAANSVGFGMFKATVSNVATSLAFNQRVTYGTILGGLAGGAIGGLVPGFSGIKGGVFANTIGELGHETLRGSITGAVSGGIGAGIDGGNIADGMLNGAYHGAIGGAVSAGLMIGGFGAGIKPTGKTLQSLNKMEAHFASQGMSMGKYAPIYRRGGLYSLLLTKRGVTWGRNLIIPENDHDTFIHETVHYYQQFGKGSFFFQGKGIYEQTLNTFGRDPYSTPGTNEYNAEYWTNIFK